jgi:Pectate lyase superfamily protein
MVALPLMLLLFSPFSQAQLWAPILGPSQAIDWSKPGVGEIPARRTKCAILLPPATLVEINSALASCPSGDAVYLAPGTYSIAGTISVPSNVTLRGAGANLTILNATGTNGGDVVRLGSGSVSYNPVRITSGATAGSTCIEVGNASDISAGNYLAIAEINDTGHVPTQGSETDSSWSDRGWNSTGSLERGQIVAVTSVHGTTITISPGLYATYANTPIAVPFSMSDTYAGVEDLQVNANNAGYAANFGMSECAYCWIKGVESNYTDGNHVEVYWGYHDEIRDSYFSNTFLHTSKAHDFDIQIALKTSASLVENNIIEPTRGSVTLGSGAAGNVVSYNYATEESDGSSVGEVGGGIGFHGADPQFNLLEGNVLTNIYADPVCGTSGRKTSAFRNWVIGAQPICSPTSSRGTVACSGANGRHGFQAPAAAEMSDVGVIDNFVGNIIGSVPEQPQVDNWSRIAKATSIEYPSVRSYDTVGLGQICGYSSTGFFHGNFNSATGSITWADSVTQTLPASFYLPSEPSWWGSIPFPATGPDIVGGAGPGSHSYGNPAQLCYLRVMGRSDGGAEGPLAFNASTCYGTGRQPPQAPTGLTVGVRVKTP